MRQEKACFALAREGDWTAAIERAIQKIKETHSAVEIASWLIEAGLSNRSLETEVDRVGQCLNPRKPQFFKLQEWWVIQYRSGLRDLFQLECMFYGYQLPQSMQAEERDRVLAQQQREVEGVLERIKALRYVQEGHRSGRQFFGVPHFSTEEAEATH